MATVTFGRCLIDLDARQILRDGQPVHVSHKAFELLKILIAERPRALSKSELHERIWPGTFVSDDSLAGLVAEARAGIGDPARNAEFLRTIHGFGYGFAPGPEAAQLPASSATQSFCWLVVDRRAIALTEGENIIGREPTAQLVLDSARVSRRHANVVVDRGCARVEDLGSRNGTSVNGTRIATSVRLADGDEITVGGVALTFRSSVQTPPTEPDD
jgi:DNA-binding winged helix-turn-helix (wHTH) protein